MENRVWVRFHLFHAQLGKLVLLSETVAGLATAPPWVRPVSHDSTNPSLPTAIVQLSQYFSDVFTTMLDLCSWDCAMSRSILCNLNTTLQRSWLWTMYGRVFTLHPSVWLVPDEAEPSTCQTALGLNWGAVWLGMNNLLIMHLSGSGFNKQIEQSVFHSVLSWALLSLWQMLCLSDQMRWISASTTGSRCKQHEGLHRGEMRTWCLRFHYKQIV